MKKVFGTKLSKWIMGLYWLILLLLVVMLVGIPLVANMSCFQAFVFSSVHSLAVLLLVFIIIKALRIKFSITKNELIIDGIFCKNIIKISDIKSVQKTYIPFGFRLFGASFLGGWHYFPAIGTAWVVMGNFEDGVLITTKQKKHYLITPENPLEFIKILKKKKGK